MPVIVGRRTEFGVLDGCLDDAAAGAGGALVVRGEAGIGKSAMLNHAVGRAAALGMRTLGTAGVQAEVHIPYAGLHRMLHTAPDLVGAAAVLDEPDTEPYRAALVLLNLLAGGGPLLLAVEDAHWLDQASWEALTFAARRLGAHPIAMVFTTRDGEDVDARLTRAGLTELRLAPLDATDSAALLARVAPELGPSLGERVLEQAAGNPLGIVELGEVAARRGGGALLPSWLPLSERLERTFAGLVAELPPPTRSLLVVAALNDRDDLDEIVEACRRLGDGREAGPGDVEPAVVTRLVHIDDRFRLRFRHPLLRSALYQAATAAQRRAVHAALAQTVIGDPERRIWHRAAAADGPDEELARELTALAKRAGSRQAAEIELAAFERAARLSEDPQARGRRLLDAADTAADQGDAATAVRLLNEVREHELTPVDRALNGLLREILLGESWTGGDRLAGFAEVIETMAAAGDARALDALSAVSLRVFWSDVDPATVARLVAAAERIDPGPYASWLVLALSQIAPVARGAWCLDRVPPIGSRTDLDPGEAYALGAAANAVGAHPLAAAYLTTAAVGLRAQGRIGNLAKVLVAHAHSAVHLGDARTARALAAEGATLARELRQGSWVLTAELMTGLADALAGATDAARAHADAAVTALLPGGRTPLLALPRYIRGVAALADGRPAEAFAELYRVLDPADDAYHLYTGYGLVAHLAEAAAGCGATAELGRVVAELTPVAEESRSPMLRVGLAYARAVLADTADGFEEALAADLQEWPFERARLQHAFAARLRRQRRQAQSRPLLRAAVTTFDALGAAAWARRSGAELRASGETLRRSADAARDLTPQETQIAHLAADGLSNRDIAERLYLSPRTVTTHLARIYPKLGITSRGELARALGRT